MESSHCDYVSPKLNISTINLNIVNSQLCPWWINMNGVIINLKKHQKDSENLTKKFQIITHPVILNSPRTIATPNANP